MFIFVHDVTYIETQYYHSKLRNFIILWKMVRNTIKLCIMLFPYKINKRNGKKSRDEMFCFLGMMLPLLNWKLCNLITLWNLIKIPKNLCEAVTPKYWHKCAVKTEMKFYPQVLFKMQFCIKVAPQCEGI